MKKYIAKLLPLALALVMVVALAACGGDSGKPGGSENTAPTVVHTFTGNYTSTASDAKIDFKLEMLSDGTLTVTPSTVFFDLEDHEDPATGNWKDEGGTLKFNIANTDKSFAHDYEVAKSGDGYTFEMHVSLATFDRPITMTESK